MEHKKKEFPDEIDRAVKGYKSSRRGRREFWRYLSRVSVAGWLFVLPIIAGAYLGTYLDKRTGSTISWTITLIIIGIAAGIYNVWYFIYDRGNR